MRLAGNTIPNMISLKKHGFELKFFFFNFFETYNQIKIHKTDVKLQACEALQILCKSL